MKLFATLLICSALLGQSTSRAASQPVSERIDLHIRNGARIIVEQIAGAHGCALCLAFALRPEAEDREVTNVMMRLLVTSKTGSTPTRTLAAFTERHSDLTQIEVADDCSFVAMACAEEGLERELVDVASRLTGFDPDPETTRDALHDLWPKGDPRDDIKATALCRALKKWGIDVFSPSEATLVIVGACNARKTMDRARALLEQLTSSPVPQHEPWRPIGGSISTLFLPQPRLGDWYLTMSWQTPAPGDPDFPAAITFAGTYLPSLLQPFRGARRPSWSLRGLSMVTTIDGSDVNSWRAAPLDDSAIQAAIALVKGAVTWDLSPEAFATIKDRTQTRLGLTRPTRGFEPSSLLARSVTLVRHVHAGIDTAAFEKAIETLTLDDMRRVGDAILAVPPSTIRWR